MVPERDEEKRERFSAHIPPVFLESFVFMNSSDLKHVVISVSLPALQPLVFM